MWSYYKKKKKKDIMPWKQELINKGKKIKTEKEDLDKDCLDLWSEIVKLKAGYKCQFPNCRKTTYLNSHHIFTRGIKATRYDPDNGLCLCSGHHTLNNDSAHKSIYFKDTMIKAGVLTEEFLTKLHLRTQGKLGTDLKIIKYWLIKERDKLL